MPPPRTETREPLHGGEVWRTAREHRLDPSSIVDFSSNINPLGPPTSSLKSIRDNVWKISSYPDSTYSRFRNQVAKNLKLGSPDHIIEGAGSTELIQLFAEVLIAKGDRVIIPVPTYGEYERVVGIRGGTSVPIFPTGKLAINVTGILAELEANCKALMLCNPNNPTSTTIPRKELLTIMRLAQDEGVSVLLDESFIEFVDQAKYSLASQVKEFSNLFILRSLTKFYAFPGLRVGYGLASLELAGLLRKAKMPWSLNSLGEEAAIAAMRDSKYKRRTRELISKERDFLYAGLKHIAGLEVSKPEANFILVRISSGMNAADIKALLLKRHSILIRDCESFTGLGKDYFRVSVRNRRENSSLLSALKEIVL